MSHLHLLAVVEVDPQDRVVCQAPGCGHGVYKRIHIVADTAGVLHVYGADCFAKLSGQGARAAAGGPRYGNGEGRLLNAAERALLAENTARLIELFEAERQTAIAVAAERAAAEAAERDRAARAAQAAAEQAAAVAVAQRAAAERAHARQQEDAAMAAARRAALEREAREFVRAQYGVDPDAPGWVGLVKLRVQALLKQQT